MLKRIFAIMSLLVLFIVQAHAVADNGLKAAFDELNYSLSVEWDQQDQNFYKETMSKFTGQISDLQKSGLTNEELVNFTLSQLKDKKLQADVEKTFALVELNKMSAEQAQDHVKQLVNHSYNRGASWGGSVMNKTYLIVLIIAIVVIVASGDDEPQEEEEEECLNGRGWGECCYPSSMTYGGGHHGCDWDWD